MDYSQKIARLEEILSQMERGALPLEKTLELYQEGQTLVSECRAFLNQAEKTVKKLEDDGSLSEFEEEEEA